ncbi:MAG: DUF4917 family protein [Planctomycetota bacterium]
MTPPVVISFADAVAKTAHEKHRHVLLGNGFSRAWRDDIFSYSALLDQAASKGLSPDARSVFDKLNTTDFETVMRALRDAAIIVGHYTQGASPLTQQLEADAASLREILVQAIAGNHPARLTEITQSEFAHARTFLAHFERTYTVNYDLLLYWTFMQAEIEPVLQPDDGFRTPDDGPCEYVTWGIENSNKQNTFYLHGALHLFDAGHELKKYTWSNTGIALMDQVRSALIAGLFPIFVSEGTSEQKLGRIKHSDFLSRGYRSFANIGGCLFIHGHSMSPQDEHITSLIETNKVHTLAVGLRTPLSASSLLICERCEGLVTARAGTRHPLVVMYYDAASAAVWRAA